MCLRGSSGQGSRSALDYLRKNLYKLDKHSKEGYFDWCLSTFRPLHLKLLAMGIRMCAKFLLGMHLLAGFASRTCQVLCILLGDRETVMGASMERVWKWASPSTRANAFKNVVDR